MSLISDAAGQLETALAAVEDEKLRLYQLGDRIDPPALVVAMPTLQWDAMCLQPTSATFPVYLMVPFDERARDKLWDLIDPVSDALDRVPDAVVRSANPVPFNANGTDLPSYEFSVEVAL